MLVSAAMAIHSSRMGKADTSDEACGAGFLPRPAPLLAMVAHADLSRQAMYPFTLLEDLCS